jgi:NitT/TauT family transport system ATP-binding protein
VYIPSCDIDESVYTGDRVIVLPGAPGRVRADLTVQLPEPRDQITTKELPAFVQLRSEVSRLIRGQQAPAPCDPMTPGRTAPLRPASLGGFSGG